MKRMSKKTAFTPAQNAALRKELALLNKTRSQVALGQELGIKQQNVGRLLNNKDAGFAYTTASRLVRMAGFVGVDAFFARMGLSVTEAPDSEPGVSHHGLAAAS
jgi:hypothetical protein